MSGADTLGWCVFVFFVGMWLSMTVRFLHARAVLLQSRRSLVTKLSRHAVQGAPADVRTFASDSDARAWGEAEAVRTWALDYPDDTPKPQHAQGAGLTAAQAGGRLSAALRPVATFTAPHEDKPVGYFGTVMHHGYITQGERGAARRLLHELRLQREADLITAAEYDEQTAQIISEMWGTGPVSFGMRGLP